MQEIIDLKQQLLLGNFDEAIDITIEIEAMARQDKINAIGNLTVIVLTRLIIIQISDRLTSDDITAIRNSLIHIQQQNRLCNPSDDAKSSSFYIENDDEWLQLIEMAYPTAILNASENKELQNRISIEQLKNHADRQLLQTEALLLIRLTYTFNAYEIDKYVRSHYSQKQIV